MADDIPLNDGCLKPLRLIIPPGTFLSPQPGAAVVAGNTEVSQATCNALFGALKPIACSQATMNNFLFGDAHRQYYETICGGTGAGPGFDGTSAIHSHMTNTRMTDPEVLELRYPVRLERFAIRRGSGGDGKWHGGDGAIRRIRFLEPMTAVIVSSRRNVAPFGLEGGEDGAVGRQWVERADGTHEILTGTDSAELAAGRCVRDRNARRRRLRDRCLTCHACAQLLVAGAGVRRPAAARPSGRCRNGSTGPAIAPRSRCWPRPRSASRSPSADRSRSRCCRSRMLTAAQVNVGGSGPADLSIHVRGAAAARSRSGR